MTGDQKIEHAHLYVEDLDASLKFYTDVMGLTEFERDGGVVYLGCGYDGNYDLAVEEGGTGIEHFAIRVPDEDALASFEARLDGHGVEYERRDEAEPGQKHAVRFALPSGVAMELVVVDNSTYKHPCRQGPKKNGVTPLDLDHVNLMTPDVKATIEFTVDVLGFRLSEVARFGDSDGWELAFARYGDTHHDIGATFGANPDHTLAHLAWKMVDINHMRSFLDEMALYGHELEVGISRHSIGANLFCYFWTPGGNRFELDTEMATLDPTTEPVFHDERTNRSSFTAWGGVDFPETWSLGS